MWSKQKNKQYGYAWRKLREVVLARDNYLCQLCHEAGVITNLTVGNRKHNRSANVDHIIPLSQGGTDALANLQALCLTCHKRKTAAEAKGETYINDLGCTPDGEPKDPNHHWNFQ